MDIERKEHGPAISNSTA